MRRLAHRLLKVLAGFFEEIGWTGYALPRMLGKRSVLLVAVGLGLLLATFIVSMTAMRVFVVWTYANTRSVLLAQLVHASSTGFLAVLVALFGKNLVRDRAC